MIMAPLLFLNTSNTIDYRVNVYVVCALYTVPVIVFTFCTRQIIDNPSASLHICCSVIKNKLRQKNHQK
jgi:hypothetical protein